jgi:hypothetical protein
MLATPTFDNGVQSSLLPKKRKISILSRFWAIVKNFLAFPGQLKTLKRKALFSPIRRKIAFKGQMAFKGYL